MYARATLLAGKEQELCKGNTYLSGLAGTGKDDEILKGCSILDNLS
jgi:hypothetical protein